MSKSKVGICYSAYINQDCTPDHLSESILKVYREFKDLDYDVEFYATVYDPRERNAVEIIDKLREDHELPLRLLIEPVDKKYKHYCTKGHAMCNGAVTAYLDGCDYIGFMDGDETVPNGKFPVMIEAVDRHDAEICFVDMPRTVFSGLVTNSFLVYFTCYLKYEVPGFISGYYLLNKQLVRKVFPIENEKVLNDTVQSEIDIDPATFMKISDSTTGPVTNYRNWAIDTAIVVISLVEHQAKCCSAKVTPKIDRSALSYSDTGVQTIENMFNQLIGGIAHMMASYDLSDKQPGVPQKPPVHGTYSERITHEPINVDAYGQIVNRYKIEREKEYEKIISTVPGYFQVSSVLENADQICENHGILIRQLVLEIDKNNHEFIGRCLVMACMHFMTLRVGLLTGVVQAEKDVVAYSNQIKKQVMETLLQ